MARPPLRVLKDWVERNGLDPTTASGVTRGAFEEGWRAGREALVGERRARRKR